MSERYRRLFFVALFALVFYLVGASFVESFVTYPTWRLVGSHEFPAYYHELASRIVRIRVLPGVLEIPLCVCLLWLRPRAIPRWPVAIARHNRSAPPNRLRVAGGFDRQSAAIRVDDVPGRRRGHARKPVGRLRRRPVVAGDEPRLPTSMVTMLALGGLSIAILLVVLTRGRLAYAHATESTS